ncbi:MAG: hypothetical protein CBE14_002555 [Rickettsiales bacterium TMED254]|nr:hypothetical protein [Rickettsiales bacterium]RPF76314.1 MAG: hypothetical protein CBE14_002555 [Rickettsiales bacterium TMED254]
MIDKKKYYKHNNKSFIVIEGEERNSFLQGLISNDLNKIDEKNSIYSSLLTPQGKILYDFFISNYQNSYLIECSTKIVKDLIQKLSIYKLRSNVNIYLKKEFDSFVIRKTFYKDLKKISKDMDIIFFIDPRFDLSLMKFYCNKFDFKKIKKQLSLDYLKKNEFEDLRLKNTIPDFDFDSNNQKSLLLELRFDELNGIDWEKGCYIGQELTSRTKFRGNLKKKLFGIEISGFINKKKEVYYCEKLVGEIKSFNKKFGIAILNIEATKNCITNKEFMICDKAKIKPFIPKWVKL